MIDAGVHYDVGSESVVGVERRFLLRDEPK